MNAPTPDQAREAVDKLVIYANNGWGSACPGEVDTLRRFIDAHSAPVQPEPVGWANAVEWLRNHYQDHPTIDGLCSAMRSASPPPAQPTSYTADELSPPEGWTDERIADALDKAIRIMLPPTESEQLQYRATIRVMRRAEKRLRAAQPTRESLTGDV